MSKADDQEFAPMAAARISRASWDVYQEWTVSTARYCGAGERTPEALLYCTLGLAGETGEIVEKVKKAMRGDSGTAGLAGVGSLAGSEALLSELGDVLYYLARLAEEAGFPLSRVVERNVEKLESRRARGSFMGRETPDERFAEGDPRMGRE